MVTWFENPTYNSLAGVCCKIETTHNQKLEITKAQIINLFFLTLPEHCNISEDIQQSCLTVTINGM
jgi:hypothetical protein